MHAQKQREMLLSLYRSPEALAQTKLLQTKSNFVEEKQLHIWNIESFPPLLVFKNA